MNISFEYKSLIFGAVLGSSFFFGVQYFLGSMPESAIVFYFSALAVFMLLFLLSMIIMYFVNRSIKNNLEEISKRLRQKGVEPAQKVSTDEPDRITIPTRG